MGGLGLCGEVSCKSTVESSWLAWSERMEGADTPSSRDEGKGRELFYLFIYLSIFYLHFFYWGVGGGGGENKGEEDEENTVILDG